VDGVTVSTPNELVAWFRDLLANHADASQAVDDAYQQLANAGLISKVVVHRYICRDDQGCQLATVIKIDSRILCRTRDYKQSPGLNAASSVPTARAARTLDGDRHWPSHTFDVTALDHEGVAVPMNCRHARRNVLLVDILAAVGTASPGHPGKPSIL